MNAAMDTVAARIETATARDASAWDAYVEAHPDATFFHLFGWAEVLGRGFGHDAHYLLARDGQRIIGVLPLVHLRSRLFGNALTSMPFCERGGVLADSEGVTRQLTQAAIALADKLAVGQLEFRGAGAFDELWLGEETYFNFAKTITADHDENLKAIPRKQRAMVRKGIEQDLVTEVSQDIDTFYRVYATSVHGLGTPVFGKRYFRELMRVFGDRCDITTIRAGDEACAAVLSFWFRDTVLPYYGGGTPLARSVKGFDYMYWQLMCQAADRGMTRFDYGRSKAGTGAFSFKKNWGFTPEPLGYRYRLIRATEKVEKNPNSPKYRRFVEGWKRLPLPVANALGPWLARSLG